MANLRITNSLSVLILLLIITMFFLISGTFSKKPKNLSETKLLTKNIFAYIQDEKITNIFRWSLEDGQELLCVSRKISLDGKQENLVLQIYKDGENIIYQEDFGEFGSIEKMYSIYALRKNYPQLAVEVNSGGSSTILHLLDINDGKILSLINTNESDFDISAEIKPQTKSVKDIRNLPFQIYLTSQIASFSEPKTRVFSFEKGKYVLRGEFPTSKVDEYSEKLLRTQKSE